jgi:NTP pyrophosphatase (non-canonical NTP hydrolase)
MESRPLDDWYKTINSIYLDRNFYRDSSSIFMHLVEVVGGLSPLASGKVKAGTDPEAFLPKAVAWWLALCGKVGVNSVEEMIWAKFPKKCPYCLDQPHRADCGPNHGVEQEPDWDRLRRLGANVNPRFSLAGWQDIFFRIYPMDRADHERAISRLLEELAELAEALRVVSITPKPFLNEASDVFAWLMNVANGIDVGAKRISDNERGKWLQQRFYESYPDKCSGCGRSLCACPPLVSRTLLRLGEMASDDIAPLSGANILSVAEVLDKFRTGATAIKIDGQEVPATGDQLRMLRELLENAIKDLQVKWKDSDERTQRVLEMFARVEDLAASQRVTQGAIDELIVAVKALPPPERSTLADYLNGISSSIWAEVLMKMAGG